MTIINLLHDFLALEKPAGFDCALCQKERKEEGKH